MKIRESPVVCPKTSRAAPTSQGVGKQFHGSVAYVRSASSGSPRDLNRRKRDASTGASWKTKRSTSPVVLKPTRSRVWNAGTQAFLVSRGLFSSPSPFSSIVHALFLVRAHLFPDRKCMKIRWKRNGCRLGAVLVGTSPRIRTTDFFPNDIRLLSDSHRVSCNLTNRLRD